MIFAIGVTVFALGIAISIALHEAGHLWTAKAFGMRVRRYFIGFGPRLFSFRRGTTEYGVKAIPAGGFCDIAGMTALDEVTPDEAPHAFCHKPTWQRVVVLSAGSAMHFVLGFLLLYGLAVSVGMPNATGVPIAGDVSCASDQSAPRQGPDPCGPGVRTPAADAGLLPSDTIVAVAGVATPSWTEAVAVIQDSDGPTPIVVERGGEDVTLSVDVAPVQRIDAATGEALTVGAIGVALQTEFQYGPVAAVPGTLSYTGDLFVQIGQRIVELPQRIPALFEALGGGERDENTPVSVVGASIIGGDLAAAGLWAYFIYLLAVVNFFVGVFNLLPLLPLDGGHITVNVYERFRDGVRTRLGKAQMPPVDYTRLLPITLVLIVVGGGFSLLVLAADIVNPIRLQ